MRLHNYALVHVFNGEGDEMGEVSERVFYVYDPTLVVGDRIEARVSAGASLRVSLLCS